LRGISKFEEAVMEKSYDYLKELIRDIPDFPIEGVLFRDITTLLKDTKGLKDVIDIFSDRYRDKGIKYILGADARGFIFGAAIAYNIGAGFVPKVLKTNLTKSV
jgi:adenine phosphoribosyltransferase